jgi:hypothetical protein
LHQLQDQEQQVLVNYLLLKYQVVHHTKLLKLQALLQQQEKDIFVIHHQQRLQQHYQVQRLKVMK